MSFFAELDGPQDAYRHNGDHKLLTSLGLKTHGFMREWTDLGTVVLEEEHDAEVGAPSVTTHYPARTIKVEVSAYPAQFWRFTIKRPHEECSRFDESYNFTTTVTEKTFVMETGSGGFTEYWEMAQAIARGMVVVTEAQS